jgi:hypothetical protein
LIQNIATLYIMTDLRLKAPTISSGAIIPTHGNDIGSKPNCGAKTAG